MILKELLHINKKVVGVWPWWHLFLKVPVLIK